MEIAIIKRETTGSGPNSYSDTETVAKYEIMDGAPVRGEVFKDIYTGCHLFYMFIMCHASLYILSGVLNIKIIMNILIVIFYFLSCIISI